MFVYLVDIETRKGDRNDTLGPFSCFGAAQRAIMGYFTYWDPESLATYNEFGSDFSKGEIYTEEESVTIIERELD